MDALRKLIPLSVLFVVCDLPWLYVSSEWSHSVIKKVQGGLPVDLRLYGAPPIYLALAYLVQLAHSNIEAFLIGLSVYAVYDFTNYVTLTKYELPFAITDSLWGGTLFVIVRSVAIYLNIL